VKFAFSAITGPLARAVLDAHAISSSRSNRAVERVHGSLDPSAPPISSFNFLGDQRQPEPRSRISVAIVRLSRPRGGPVTTTIRCHFFHPS